MSSRLQRAAGALLLHAALALAPIGCAGAAPASAPAPAGGAAAAGTTSERSITSAINGSTYPLRIYTPPPSAGARSALPVVYVLDGDSWFGTLAELSARSAAPFIVVAVGDAGLRTRDYVPPNSCTPNGGGHLAFFDFMRRELIPLIEATVGGDPRRRALFGHSHSGSFVVYALFAEPPTARTFAAYASSDASLPCMLGLVFGWEDAYRAAHGPRLTARLHLSYSTQGNPVANRDWGRYLALRGYSGLALTTKAYDGSHMGIVPAAFADAVAAAFPAVP